MSLSSIENEGRDGETVGERSAPPRNPAPTTEPNDATERIDTWRGHLVSDLAELSRRHGKVLFDGEWMSPEQVRRHHWRLRWRSLRMIFDVIILWLGLVCVAGVIWLMLLMMGG